MMHLEAQVIMAPPSRRRISTFSPSKLTENPNDIVQYVPQEKEKFRALSPMTKLESRQHCRTQGHIRHSKGMNGT
jgi:hypothetical protein